MIGSIAVGIVIEGRAGTPLIVGFILPLIFAAISYPVRRDGDRRLARADRRGDVVGPDRDLDRGHDVRADGARLRRRRWASGRPTGASAAPRSWRIEHRRAQRYLDVAGTLIVVLDADGTIGTVNRKTLRGAGLQRGGADGPGLVRARRPRRDPPARPARPSTTRSTGTAAEDAERETPVLTRAGERRWMAWTGRVVQTRNGDGLLIAGEDVTEQRAAQERVQHMAYHDALTGLGQPRQARGARHAGARPRAPPRHRRRPSSTSTSTTSSSSTTRSATPPGDELLRQVADAARGPHAARATCSPATAATSSCCCSPTSTTTPARPPTGSRTTCWPRSRRRS